MELDQLEKRVEWLDEERRADKKTIAELQKQVQKMQTVADKSSDYIKELNSEIIRLNVVLTKVDNFEKVLGAHGVDVKKELDAHEERAKKREKDAKKALRQELDETTRQFSMVRDGLDDIKTVKMEMQSAKEESSRLERLIGEAQKTVMGVVKSEEERSNSFLAVEETYRQETKRILDIQGEVSALRSRADEFRGQMELVLDSQRKLDSRLNEMQAADAERRSGQNTFIEKLTTAQDERERAWKEWEKRFTAIEAQSKQLASHLENISETERAVKRAQDAFEEISGQLNRRMNEITEMQRLGEERFRQEWATFRADDQKRWTNYTLTQEELQRENSRRLERLIDQAAGQSDTIQEIQDLVNHVSDQSDKLLQAMLANLRDWVAENERFLGSVR